MSAVPDTLASATDYAEWTKADAPDDIDVILRECTSMVLDATKLAIYAVNSEGVATDANVKKALQDATCIQASAWVTLGISAGGVITSTVKKSKKIGTASIEYADAGDAARARQAAVDSLVPGARRKLRLAGLIGFAPGRA